MKKCLWFLVYSSLAFGWTAEDAVVKVQSRQCQSTQPFVGSGVLFTSGPRVLVLTSDHVVYHSTLYCHSINIPGESEVEAKFLSAEWGNGLALLEIPTLAPKAKWPRLADLRPAKIVKGRRARVMGYPHQSSHLVVDTGARVTHPDFVSSLFGLLPRLVLVDRAHGEFGMSGGPVFGGDDLVGILSHQILKSGQNRLLLIPGNTALDWVKDQVEQGPSPKTWFFEEAAKQNSKYASYQSGEFSFGPSCDGFDPSYCYIRMQRFGSHHSVEYRDPRGWIRKFMVFFRSFSSSSRAGHVRYFRRSRRPTMGPLIPVTTAAQFIQWLHDPTLEPIFTSHHQIFYGSHVVKLKPRGESLAKLLKGLKPSGMYRRLVDDLTVVGELLATIPPDYTSRDDRWMMVQYRDIRRLTYSLREWEAFSKDFPTEAAEARALLGEIEKYLGKVTLKI